MFLHQRTPLWYVVHLDGGYKSQRGDLVRCLVDKGADVNIKNKDGVSEWDYYSHCGV